MATNPNDYALVIGINDYPRIRELKGAVNDAKAFAGWLTKDDGGGIDPTNCMTVLSTPNPLSPDQTNIDDKIEELWNQVLANSEAGNKPRRLYFYFSGHGIGVDPTDVGLCYTVWSRTRKAALLSSDKYLTYFKKKGAFKEIIVVLDCCRLREDAQGAFPTLTDVEADQENTPKVVSLTLFGSEFLSPTIEALNNTTQEVRGFFTEALIDGLNGKAARPSGEITLENLRNYLEREVPQRSRNQQKPRFLSDGMADSTVIYSGTKAIVPYPYDDSVAVKLEINYEPGINAEVTVYTLNNEIKHRGTSTGSCWLSKGKHVVVVNYPDFIDTAELDMKANTKFSVNGEPFQATEPVESTRSPLEVSDSPVARDLVKIKPPESASLIEGNRATHEIFSNPAQKSSIAPTHAITEEKGSRLLIFIRHAHPKDEVDKTEVDKSMATGLALTDSIGQLRATFAENELFVEDKNDTERYKRDGYIALSVEAKPGLYYLNYFGKTPRQMPIRLYEYRQTVVFMLYDGQPLFDTTRIFLPSIGEGYQVYNTYQKQENADLDTAITLFQNNQSFISPNVVRELLNGKFSNPMLGIIGGYLLLRGRLNKESWYADFLKNLLIRDPSWTESNYFRVVINNLSNLLSPNDPDVKVIRWLASDFLDQYQGETYTFDEPPIIDWGLRQIISRSSINPALINLGSIILTIAPKIYADSVYCSWSHTETYENLVASKGFAKSIASPEADDWVKFAVCDQMINFMKRAEKKGSKDEKAPTAENIARSVGLPLPVIENTIRELGDPDNWWWQDPEFVDQLNLSTSQLQALPILLQSALPKILSLDMIDGIGFDEVMSLSEQGIETVDALAQIGDNSSTLENLASQIHQSIDVVSGWIKQAKALISQ